MIADLIFRGWKLLKQVVAFRYFLQGATNKKYVLSLKKQLEDSINKLERELTTKFEKYMKAKEADKFWVEAQLFAFRDRFIMEEEDI